MRDAAGQTAETNLPQWGNETLLGAIRQKETNITRDLAAARDSAEREIAEAKEQAERLIAQAAEDGRLQGAAEREAALKEVERETAEIRAQAEAKAAALLNTGDHALAAAANHALNLITHAG
jgi:vacuolar-type H+-ATPase subunit H